MSVPGDVLYSVPSARMREYSEHAVVVRFEDVRQVLDTDPASLLPHLRWVQLLRVDAEGEGLLAWSRGVPIELVLSRPADYPYLYAYTGLRENHPLRVVLRAERGVGRAARVALALGLPVRLLVRQPEPGVVEEMAEVLDLYLHQATVAAPVEFYQSMLLVLFHGGGGTLWASQGEDPAFVRYVTESGGLSVSQRLDDVALEGPPGAFLTEFQATVLAEGGECRACEFRDGCGGYFKLPDRTFSCRHIVVLLGRLAEAARELRRDAACAHEDT